MQPPYFLSKSVMGAVAELEDYDAQLYHVAGGGSEPTGADDSASGKEEAKSKSRGAASGAGDAVLKTHAAVSGGGEDKYLIATSEQPLCALHMGQSIDSGLLPLQYAGFSTCFRKEAGSHGRDTWGIYRVHQFDKVEQFVICEPHDSWAMHERMIRAAEELYQSLGFAYR